MSVAEEFDGRFYAKGDTVFRSPRRYARGIRMGFALCDVRDGVSADSLAQTLNQALDMGIITDSDK